MNIPTERQAIVLLKKFGCNELIWYRNISVLEHSQIISKHCLRVARKIKNNGYRVNLDLVQIGALLHDLAMPLIDKEITRCQHGFFAGKVLRKLGYPEIAKIAERHYGNGLSKEEIIENNLPLPKENFIPQTIEEKIVNLVDRLSNPVALREKKLIEEVKSPKTQWTRFQKMGNELTQMAKCNIENILYPQRKFLSFHYLPGGTSKA